MVKDMLSVAVTWGGTHRQNSRKGFGKYGYGLPSASLSIAKKYTIYSKVKGGDWHNIVFDITKLEGEGKPDLDEIRSIPKKCALPKFINDFEGENFNVKKLEHGTIIHYEELAMCITTVRIPNEDSRTWVNIIGKKLTKNPGNREGVGCAIGSLIIAEHITTGQKKKMEEEPGGVTEA